MTLHGNPADYAWGVGGLDNIITQVGFIKDSSSNILGIEMLMI